MKNFSVFTFINFGREKLNSRGAPPRPESGQEAASDGGRRAPRSQLLRINLAAVSGGITPGDISGRHLLPAARRPRGSGCAYTF
ncbi:hypothetical protein EVAR_14110_1 [Eumeta japonica]|uniref:Uncharacterized protein n=1 Tax=Eumeta variegata TaxID=151549 RepID=A0A4C1UNK8_EUMVA|nr:hypothetical protein EVAR_14110_1 [Eumeta japonica]